MKRILLVFGLCFSFLMGKTQGIDGNKHLFSFGTSVGFISILQDFSERDNYTFTTWTGLKTSIDYHYILSRKLSIGLGFERFNSHTEFRTYSDENTLNGSNTRSLILTNSTFVDLKIFKKKKGSISPLGPYTSFRVSKRNGKINAYETYNSTSGNYEHLNERLGTVSYFGICFGIGRYESVLDKLIIGTEVFCDFPITKLNFTPETGSNHFFNSSETNGALIRSNERVNLIGLKLTLAFNAF